MTKKNFLQNSARLTCLFAITILFGNATFGQTQSIIVQTSLTPSQLNPTQLVKFNKLSGSSLHDNFQIVQVQNLATSQVNGRVRLALSYLPCNDLIFTATKVDYTSENDYYWYGIIESDDEEHPCKGGSITLMAKNGEKFGAIVFDDYSYEFQDLGDGIQTLARFKLEAIGEHECGIDSTTQGYRQSSQSQSDKLSKNNSPSPNRIIPCQPTSDVRVLVLWTQAAANIEANINNRIALGIAQTNQAYSNSQVGGTLNLVLAGSQQINFNETQSIRADVATLAGRVDIQNLRTAAQADIVVLLTNGNYADVYGIVRAIGPDFNGAYAVIQTNASTGGRFTFAHEVGHLFGCRHDDDPNGTIEHGYTFRTGGFLGLFTKQRYTLLAVMPSGKTREQNYSNPDVRIKSKPTGTSNHNNNTQEQRNNGATVANFFANPVPTFTVNIDAFQSDCYTGQAEAIIQCGTAPFTINWEKSVDGIAYQATGSGEYINFSFNCQVNTFVNLRVTVTDATGTTQVVYQHLELGNNYPARTMHINEGIKDDSSRAILSNVYPNPSSTSIKIDLNLITSAYLKIDIIDALGNIRKQIFNGTLLKGRKTFSINTSGLRSGIYQLRVISKKKTEYRQFLIVK